MVLLASASLSVPLQIDSREQSVTN